MAWRITTSDDLAATLSDMEIEAYRTSWTGEGDPVELLLSRTAALFRGAIRTGGRVKMAKLPYSLPESVISKAMDYAAFDVLKRLDVAINEDRRRARTDAEELLKRLEKGEFEPESDGEEDADNVGRNAAQLISVAPPRVTPQGLNGF